MGKVYVRQGAILSPLLYALCINDLLYLLEDQADGVSLGPTFCGCPTYADDMSLISTSPIPLQNMLDTVVSYAHCWRYAYLNLISWSSVNPPFPDVTTDSRTWFLGSSIVR